jgi:hypothetical protein
MKKNTQMVAQDAEREYRKCKSVAALVRVSASETSERLVLELCANGQIKVDAGEGGY